MTPERVILYVGSYADAAEPGIHVLAFDPAVPTLEIVRSFSGVTNPSFLAVHDDRLYAVSETGAGSGSVHAFHVDDRHRLDPLGRARTNGDYPCHLAIDRTGRWIAASNYGTGNVAVIPVTVDGVGLAVSHIQHQGSGPNAARQEGPHAHSSAFSPDNRFLLVADLGIDRVMVYAFDESNGAATHRSEGTSAPGAGPRHLVFRGDATVLVVNELDNTLGVYDFEAETGALALRTSSPTRGNGEGGSTAAAIRLAGDHAYVSNRGDDSIAVLRLEAEGAPTLSAVRSCGGSWPRSFEIAAGHTLVANRRSNEVVALPLADDGADVGEPVARVTVAEPAHVTIG